jgi:hypothetical protein
VIPSERVIKISGCVLLLVFFCLQANAGEFETKYAVVTYKDMADVREFNDELYMGRLNARVRYHGDTVIDEVIAKIDFIVEKTMSVLQMYPKPLKFSIEILPSERAVKEAFKQLYRIDVNYIAFYSPRLDRVFYSANNGRLRVVAHEIGHVVVENYFTISPPQRIHEVMAQFAEKHITD